MTTMTKVSAALTIILVMLVVSSFPVFANVLTATCNQSTCNGQFPNSTGCDASVITSSFVYPASSEVLLRRSLVSECGTFWARTKNTDSQGRSFYANATLWFPLPNGAVSYYNIPSGGKISVGQTVFTQQRYFSVRPYNLTACGYVSGNSIPGPVGSPCTP